MEFSELKSKPEGELKKLLEIEQRELQKLRFQATLKQLKNVRQIREVKKIIARILTLMNTKAQI